MVRIGADIAPLQDGLAGASGKIGDFVGEMQGAGDAASQAAGHFNDAVPPLHDMGEAAAHSKENLDVLREAITELAGGLLTFEGLKEAAVEATEAFGRMQTAQIALAAITEDAAGAAEAIERLEALAMQDALSMPSLVDAQQRLVAIGVPLQNIPQMLDAIADGAKAMNQPFETAAARFDQIVLSGQLMGRSLVSMGLSMEDVAAAMGKAGEPAAQIKQDFADLGDASERAAVITQALLTKFPDLASKAADGVEGSWQRVKNATESAFVAIGKTFDGFSGLATVAITGIKAIETAFLGIAEVAKLVADVLVAISGSIGESFMGLARALFDAAQGNFKQAWQDIQEGGTKAASYLTGAWDAMKKDFNESATSMADVWKTSSKSVASDSDEITLHFNNTKEAAKVLADAQKELTQADALLTALWRASTIPTVMDVATATQLVQAARDNLNSSAGRVIEAEGNLAAAMQLGKGHTAEQQAAIQELKNAEDAAKASKDNLAEAEKNLTASQKAATEAYKAGQEIVKALAQVDSDHAAVIAATVVPTILSQAEAMAKVQEAQNKVTEAQNAQAALADQLHSLNAADVNDKQAILTVENALVVAHGNVTAALKLLHEAQKDANDSANLMKAAASELLADETALSKFYESGLIPNVRSLATGLDDLREKKTAAVTAAENLKTATDAFNTVMQTDRSNTAAVKEATDNATAARKAYNDAAGLVTSTEQNLSRQFGVSKQALDEVSDSQTRLTTAAQNANAAMSAMGLTSSAALQDLADKAVRNFNTIVASASATGRDVDQAWLAMVNAQIAAGDRLPIAAQAQYVLITAKLKAESDNWIRTFEQVQNAITSDLSKALSDVILQTGDVGKAFEKLGTDVLDIILNKLITMGLNKLLGSLADLGGAFGSLAKTATDAVSQIDTAIGGVASGTGGAASGAGGAVGAVGAVTSSIMSSISSIVGMVTGAISAVTGIISIFQNMHQETSLNAIEHNTRYATIYIGEQDQSVLWSTQKTAERLNYVNASLDDIKGHLYTMDADGGALLEQTKYAVGDLDNIKESMWKLLGNFSGGSGTGSLTVGFSQDMLTAMGLSGPKGPSAAQFADLQEQIHSTVNVLLATQGTTTGALALANLIALTNEQQDLQAQASAASSAAALYRTPEQSYQDIHAIAGSMTESVSALHQIADNTQWITLGLQNINQSIQGVMNVTQQAGGNIAASVTTAQFINSEFSTLYSWLAGVFQPLLRIYGGENLLTPPTLPTVPSATAVASSGTVASSTTVSGGTVSLNVDSLVSQLDGFLGSQFAKLDTGIDLLRDLTALGFQSLLQAVRDSQPLISELISTVNVGFSSLVAALNREPAFSPSSTARLSGVGGGTGLAINMPITMNGHVVGDNGMRQFSRLVADHVTAGLRQSGLKF